MIFLATAVILLSLIAAAVGLPLLLRGMAVDEDPEAEEEKAARLHACEAAIEAVTDASRRAVDKPKHDIDEVSPLVDAASRLIDNYESRINGLREEQNTAQSLAERSAAGVALRLTGIAAERQAPMAHPHADGDNETG